MNQSMQIDPWLSDNLVCPRDRLHVHIESDELVCKDGHRYPIVAGIPVMLLQEVKQTHELATYSLEQAALKQEVTKTPEAQASSAGIDAFVQNEIAATNGIMYKSQVGKLKEYPIPELRAPRSSGEYFLDIGCNWGRWCIAASKLGYNPVGIDCNLESVLAANRVARQLGVQTRYVVGDARYLPFAEQTFDLVFSYSVLQHFDKSDVRLSLSEIRRVLINWRKSMVQMPNVFGLRCLYHQIRRGFREAKDFEVRYWTLSELQSTFGSFIGPTTVLVDGYFSLNPQSLEANLLPRRYRILVIVSELLRRLSSEVRFLAYVADSLYVTSLKLIDDPGPIS